MGEQESVVDTCCQYTLGMQCSVFIARLSNCGAAVLPQVVFPHGGMQHSVRELVSREVAALVCDALAGTTRAYVTVLVVCDSCCSACWLDQVAAGTHRLTRALLPLAPLVQ